MRFLILTFGVAFILKAQLALVSTTPKLAIGTREIATLTEAATLTDCVVVSGWSTFASQAAIVWCRLCRVPYVLVVESHDHDPRRAWRRSVKNAVVPRVVGNAAGKISSRIPSRIVEDRFVALSPAERTLYDAVETLYRERQS